MYVFIWVMDHGSLLNWDAHLPGPRPKSETKTLALASVGTLMSPGPKWAFPPKWMVHIMESHIQMDDLGVPPFQEIFKICVYKNRISLREKYMRYTPYEFPHASDVFAATRP